MLDLDVRLERGWSLRLASASRRVGLFGPSGAGKTTLLRVLAGLERASGRVAVGGRTFQEGGRVLPPWERKVGWVPQESTLFPHATVESNLRWAGASAAAALELARELGVAQLLGRRPRHLSGGERQRVALGRALLARPRVILLDEPFTALDPELRAEVASVVDRRVEDLDAVLVLVSHDRADLGRLCEEVWELREKGVLARVEQAGALAAR